MRFASALCLLTGLNATAQVDLPVFGKQQVINGYAKDIEGEVLSYFSVYPEHATTALLTRCTDGKKAISWETAVVPFYPQDENIQHYYFSWIAAHNSTTSGGDRSFDLFVGEEKVLTFTTHHSTQPATWSVDGVDGVKLVFEYSKMDRHGDAHGFAHLRVPRKYITPGQPLRLKVMGHAQDSPDWFMTFRYTFEEKVDVEVLPFLLKNGRQPILATVMHFGGDQVMRFSINGIALQEDGLPRLALLKNGLSVIFIEVDSVYKETPLTLEAWIPTPMGLPPSLELFRQKVSVVQHPIIQRDIHLIHHSHNDIGYSHLQSEVETIQNNNISRALELIDRTKDFPTDSRFVWNVESLWAVENFLGIASETDKQRFIAAVRSGSIALSANYANILTGLCTPEEMHWIVEYADSLRKWYGLPINSAMQTDIPGMSWSMVDAYAAHGIRYLSQGPNYIPDMPDGGDRIGSTLREQGDKPYWWKSTTGRDSILVWTAGQGYGGWHGFTAGAIKERGTRKIAAYMNELAAKGYPYDMVQWRYNIVSDNGPVDSTLSDFVRDWNEKYSSPRLIISNVGDMMAEFERKYGKRIPTWSGDFTPYWEDGAYSTAKEEGEVRVLSARLTNLIDAAKILNKPIDPHLLYRAKRSIVMPAELGADALIVADTAVMGHCARHLPSLRLHLSVQASATSHAAIEFYRQRYGVQRAVLPRVVAADQIAKIIEGTSVEIEVFAFGSLCVMVEGRCALSSYATGQSPNTAGVCSPASAVRWQEGADGVRARLGGVLIDHYAPDEPRGYPTLCKGRFDVDGQRSHALEEPTSLNTMAILPQLIAMGVRAFKIEGRQRSAAYVGDVTRTWRAAIDAACAAAAQSQAFQPQPAWTQALSRHAEGAQTTLGAFERPWR